MKCNEKNQQSSHGTSPNKTLLWFLSVSPSTAEYLGFWSFHIQYCGSHQEGISTDSRLVLLLWEIELSRAFINIGCSMACLLTQNDVILEIVVEVSPDTLSAISGDIEWHRRGG